MLTTREFARELGVVPATVRAWIRSGEVKPAGRTPGGHFRFRPEQVAECLARSAEVHGREALAPRARVIHDQVSAALLRFELRRKGIA